jgi:uronate dehydrogenase
MGKLSKSRWVITGAAGNIGTRLRGAVRALGVDLISTDVRLAEAVDDHDRVVTADLSDLAQLTALFDGADGVIHLGGLSDEADFHDLAEVNIVGTYHVLEAARRNDVSRVIYASSNRATGMYPTTTLVDVTMPPRPDGFYGVSKVAGEALCQLYSDKFDLSTIALRIGSYEVQPSTPRERHTWLSHDDAIRAFVAAMTTTEHHATFYAVSANSSPWWDRAEGERLGYLPQDDAAEWSLTGQLEEPQGGRFASPNFSLDRMRQ